ncbi:MULTISPECIES: type II toxin-antitoxin system VapC family toxin [unclassified Cellulomonas]|uniref:type II toxin-antitoxin system VapC family toxin n=1 Tax=unclassified Cellulomonas TaxID=2620175 RepID=UPI001999FDB2|nr:type II toxin-antitoxin system VapC family toxin [Cellulomonas sp. ES6]MBD3780563.1 type II toxin-antitoxin system VapC family toxin [Micrococcales bacterium]WHP17347.1 type II toxin-antitoxin system VapC family toxin [Cellulomonas sp. ES6]
MIVLDTNVLSEPLRAEPDPGVLGWLDDVDGSAAVTAVSVAELLTGAQHLPAGRRRDGLVRAIEAMAESFRDSVLPFDVDAARRYAGFQAARRAAGRPLSVEDGMIAAICASRGATLATRNTRDFAGLGLPLVDPWEAGRP